MIGDVRALAVDTFLCRRWRLAICVLKRLGRENVCIHKVRHIYEVVLVIARADLNCLWQPDR